MTVKELRAILDDIPEEAMILQRGYESGCDIVRRAELKVVYKASQPQSWNGEYETESWWATGEIDGVEAVVLGEA